MNLGHPSAAAAISQFWAYADYVTEIMDVCGRSTANESTYAAAHAERNEPAIHAAIAVQNILTTRYGEILSRAVDVMQNKADSLRFFMAFAGVAACAFSAAATADDLLVIVREDGERPDCDCVMYDRWTDAGEHVRFFRRTGPVAEFIQQNHGRVQPEMAAHVLLHHLCPVNKQLVAMLTHIIRPGVMLKPVYRFSDV